MIEALLDTDTVVALIRGNRRLRQQAQSFPAGSLAVSSITIYELLVGVEKSRDPESNRRFLGNALAPFSERTFDEAAALQAAKVRAALEKTGRGIGPYDTLIAGHALAFGKRLISANTREFGRVPNLVVENWLRP